MNLNLSAFQSQEFVVGIAVAAILVSALIASSMFRNIALALAAKQNFPDLTIMLMTGYAEQRERAKSLESIVAEVMAKPFTIADLRATVMKVIERSIG